MSLFARLARLLGITALAVGLAAVPVSQVAACSCAWQELPQAIAESDVAIVGSLIATRGGDAMGMEPMTMRWAVERSRDPIPAGEVTIRGFVENGANCGVSFDADERWLVLAYQSEAGLETNGCLRNTRLSDVGPDDEAVIAELVAARPADGAAGSGGLDLPVPILLGGAAVLVVAAISFVAFRRAGPDGA